MRGGRSKRALARVRLLATLSLHRHLILCNSLTDVLVTIPYLDVVALVPIVGLPDAHVRRSIVILINKHLSVVIALHLLGQIAIPSIQQHRWRFLNLLLILCHSLLLVFMLRGSHI